MTLRREASVAMNKMEVNKSFEIIMIMSPRHESSSCNMTVSVWNCLKIDDQM